MLFVSHNHHDEVPQTGWFIKITEMYSFTVLQAKNLKSRCHQSQVVSKDSRLKFFLFQVLVVARNLWWCLASGRITPFSTFIFMGRFSTVCVCVQISLFFTRTLATRLRPNLLQYDLILTCSHLQTPYLQLRWYSQVPGGHEFRGNLSCQYIPSSVKLTKLNIKNPTYVSSQHSY